MTTRLISVMARRLAIMDTSMTEPRWARRLESMKTVDIYRAWPWLSGVVSPRELDPGYDIQLEQMERALG